MAVSMAVNKFANRAVIVGEGTAGLVFEFEAYPAGLQLVSTFIAERWGSPLQGLR